MKLTAKFKFDSTCKTENVITENARRGKYILPCPVFEGMVIDIAEFVNDKHNLSVADLTAISVNEREIYEVLNVTIKPKFILITLTAL